MLLSTRLNNGRGREIRTPDPLVPNQMRYQAALCPDNVTSLNWEKAGFCNKAAIILAKAGKVNPDYLN